jgi:hypothetical protein
MLAIEQLSQYEEKESLADGQSVQDGVRHIDVSRRIQNRVTCWSRHLTIRLWNPHCGVSTAPCEFTVTKISHSVTMMKTWHIRLLPDLPFCPPQRTKKRLPFFWTHAIYDGSMKQNFDHHNVSLLYPGPLLTDKRVFSCISGTYTFTSSWFKFQKSLACFWLRTRSLSPLLLQADMTKIACDSCRKRKIKARADTACFVCFANGRTVVPLTR